MAKRSRLGIRLPFIYGEKARSTSLKEEQQNRLNSLWFCEAQRAPEHDERVEIAKSKPLKESIYAAENRRLESLIRRKDRSSLFMKKKKPKPRIVQDMITLEHRYQMSAKIVQKAWRRYSSRSFWQRYFLAVRAAIVIQRVIRGALCRKYVKIWYLSRIRFVKKIQATFRGHLTRLVLSTKIAWEDYNANIIQSRVRGHISRRRVLFLRHSIAVLHIQCLWRGYCSRKESDRLWLGSKATRIQSAMRGYIARKHTKDNAVRYAASATTIQRIFRGTLARARIDVILRSRETQNRKVVMDALDAEISWYTYYLDKLERRLDKSRLKSTVVDLESELYRLHIRINDMESLYLDMIEQKKKMSPRAITGGWLVEMEDKMKKQRKMITDAKLDAVFGLGLVFKRSEAEFEFKQKLIRQITFRRQQLSKWRTDEFIDYWAREMKHEEHLRQVAFRRNVAEQRRRWAVKFHTPSGKVQITKPTPLVDTTFTMANTNILAASAHGENPIENITDQLKHLTVQAQLNQATTMFRPLLDQFSVTHQAVHGVVHDTAKPLPQSPPTLPTDTEQTEIAPSSIEHEVLHIRPTIAKPVAKPPPKSAHVEWALLDQLEAEKIKFRTELALSKTNFKKNQQR